MAQPGRMKKIYLVDRSFQLKYTWAAVLVGVISTVLTAAVILYPLYVFEILRIPRFLPWPMLVSMVVALGINIFAVGFMGVFVTHRVAGPVFSIVRHLRRIASGKWTGHMRVRRGDELKMLVRNVNDLVDALGTEATTDLELIQRVRELRKDPKELVGDGISIALDRLHERVKSRLGDALDDRTTSG